VGLALPNGDGSWTIPTDTSGAGWFVTAATGTFSGAGSTAGSCTQGRYGSGSGAVVWTPPDGAQGDYVVETAWAPCQGTISYAQVPISIAAPTPSPTPCQGDASQWNAGFGGCETYATTWQPRAHRIFRSSCKVCALLTSSLLCLQAVELRVLSIRHRRDSESSRDAGLRRVRAVCRDASAAEAAAQPAEIATLASDASRPAALATAAESSGSHPAGHRPVRV
jgi:hypothetical protein